VQALPVPAEDVTRIDTGQLTTGRRHAKQWMEREAFGADSELGDGSEDIGDDEDSSLRPPERRLLPASAVADRHELERGICDRLLRHDVMGHPESLGEEAAIAVVPVEELDHACGRAR